MILAAGYSSRMKRWKPGLVLEGVPLVVRAILPALDAVNQLILVGGYQFEELKRIVMESDKITMSQKKKIELVENKEHSAGMFSSVQVGLSRVEVSQEGTYIVPGDMPNISAWTYKTLAGSFASDSGSDVYIPVIEIDTENSPEENRLKKGHPILVRRKAFSAILEESRMSILRDVLKQFHSKTIVVPDSGICFDIDEERDVAKLESHFSTARNPKNGPRV